MSQSGSARPLVATLAIAPLVALFPLEVFRLAFGLGGATSFGLGLQLGWVTATLVSLVLAGSLVAFLLGGVRRDSPVLTGGSLRLQRWAGLICWAFVALHLSHLWRGLVQFGPDPLSQYEFLRNWLSLPINVAFYVIGLAAMSLYLVQGIPALAHAWGFARLGSHRRWEIATGILAWLFFVFTINILSHYATGAAMWSVMNDVPNTGGTP